ncbi:MAG: terpene cyclase/mutase family protein [Myxococcales bacterium]|nr:terpene cyclase/mutase family protein [Myxococcales bacterium]MDD9965947.1 terpene cyclase/mutase family protein [Myxococcales bacterium]
MNTITTRGSGLLTGSALEQTAQWLTSHQQPNGEILWARDGKSDPWDHVHAAMGLAVAGRLDPARAAFRFMTSTQEEDGGWPCERVWGAPTRVTRETNHAAYIATGLWHLHQAHPDVDFLAEMWPTVERAIDWVVSLQLPSGAIAWASKRGKVWRAPLITGSSSIHGSLVCALHIAERLSMERPTWRRAQQRLMRALKYNPDVFADTDLPEKPGRHAMDWYYPVLAGALRDADGRKRLLSAPDAKDFVGEGLGCACVRDQPWYTVAETCELVLALDSVGLTDRARQVLSWTESQRDADGGYWTGTTHPDRVRFPEGEKTTWTAATVLLAHDAVAGFSRTSRFFHQLSWLSLEDRQEPRERPAARHYGEASSSPAE